MVIVGDLGDINAIGRKDGFYDAVKGRESIVEVVAEVPSEWNQEKARAGVVNALQANPDISFIFSSSDFLFPSVVAALKSANKYHKLGEPGHVILGGFDGDATAYQMLVDHYLDATGVQDVYFEAEQSLQALLDQVAKKEVPPVILDPGFVIHQGNLQEKKAQHDPARHQAAAEHAVELLDAGGDAGILARADLARRCRRPVPAMAEKRLVAAVSASVSTSVFQALQWGHWPCHFGELPPHSVQVT